MPHITSQVLCLPACERLRSHAPLCLG